MPLVHGELRRIARRCMAREPAGHTLQPTALVNEAYLRLVEASRVDWQDRAHFFALASRVMRIVVPPGQARLDLGSVTIPSMALPKVGDPAPEFAFLALDGMPSSLAARCRLIPTPAS